MGKANFDKEKPVCKKKKKWINFGQGNLNDKNIEITHIAHDPHLELLASREKGEISMGIREGQLSRLMPVATVAWWSKSRTRGKQVMSSSQGPLKTRREGARFTLNLLRAQTSSVGVVVRRGECQLRCRPHHLTMVQNYEVRRLKTSCS
ncbi:uncharacterized protein TNCV_1722251 [Trichonephila clavipes]|nr:uncharacterized protein TNCV_1722251 [Trichonephila clavipes]